MTDEEKRQGEVIADEVSRHIRVVPWRRADRMLFLAIVLLSLANVVLTILTIAYTI